MPDIVRLRFTGTETRAVPDLGRSFDPDDTIDLPGKVLDTADDHLVIEFGNPPMQRAFPATLWSVEIAKKKAAPVADEGEKA